MLNTLHQLPEGLLEIEPQRLDELLPGPTLIHLEGEHPRPLFVSVMLHGNEPTGLLALQKLLAEYRERALPRALSIFIGNVAAAALRQRRLEGQPDFNRIWGGGPGPEERMAAEVVAQMAARRPFASIDIHNNTGRNPHYACINRLTPPFLNLARAFSRTLVYFTRPLGVQSLAFAPLCPAVTLECGQPGESYGVDHAAAYLRSILTLEHLPADPPGADDYDLFHTVAVVKVPPQHTFGFDGDEADILFDTALDRYNFTELPAGTRFGRLLDPNARLQCRDEQDRDVGERYFRYQEGNIELARPVMPAMLTLDQRVIRQDCLCYLMERIEVTEGEKISRP